MWLTPNYKASDFSWPLSTDDKITIFIDRTYGWQLDIADQCINGKKGSDGKIIINSIPHSGFAVLHIVLSYFEMIAKYQDGFAKNGRSEHYFKKGVYSVFPQLNTKPPQAVDDLLKVLYSGGRCGLYHGGMTDSRISLTGDVRVPMAFDTQRSKLIINPHLLIPELRNHLKNYDEQIRNMKNSLLRDNFEKRFDYESSQT